MTTKKNRKRPAKPARAGGRDVLNRRLDPGWLIIGAVVAIGMTAMVIVIRDRSAPPPAPQATLPSVNTDILSAELRDPRVGQVEKMFRCQCGRCDLSNLTDCTCDSPKGATEMKTAIVELLARGLDVEQTVAEMSKRYGPPNTAAAEVMPVPTRAAPDLAMVAALVDCPCGNCQLRLVDCDCSRDRGAHEVKAFIAKRLQEGRSVDEIVRAVGRVYGEAAS